MNPIRELDKLISEKIMGNDIASPFTRYYSRNIEASWEVVEKIGARFSLIKENDKSTERPYKAWFEGYAVSYGETLPEAICLAALKTLEPKPKHEVVTPNSHHTYCGYGKCDGECWEHYK